MQKGKISQAEFPLMEHIWEHGPISGAELVVFAKENLNWSKSTTYTVIKRLTDRRVLRRTDPGCIMEALIDRNQVEREETNDLIGRVFRGSTTQFMTAFLKRDDISMEHLQELKKLIEEKEHENN